MSDTPVAKRLEALLNDEHDALLSGDFDRINALMGEKQTLSDALETAPVAPETLSPLRGRLRRNQELYDQALAGIRNVAARLGDLNRARKSINTYDSKGRKQSIEAPQIKRLERRA